MLISAFSFLWDEKSRNFRGGGIFIPREIRILFAISRDILNQSDDALYRIIILRYNNGHSIISVVIIANCEQNFNKP